MNAAVRQVGVCAAFQRSAVEAKNQQNNKVRADLRIRCKLAHCCVVTRARLNAEQRMRVPFAKVVKAPKVVAIGQAKRLDGAGCSSNIAPKVRDSPGLLHVQRANREMVQPHVLTHQHPAAFT
nr:hypothetical protein [Pseudorhodoferax sp. Leaf265]